MSVPHVPLADVAALRTGVTVRKAREALPAGNVLLVQMRDLTPATSTPLLLGLRSRDRRTTCCSPATCW